MHRNDTQAASTITLRPLEFSDYDAAMALWTSSPGVRGMETREEYERILKRNAGLSVAACSGEEMVGAVLCTHDGRRGYLYHLSVAEHCRRLGVGRKLVDRCLESLRQEGIRRCTIFLIAENETGEIFWKRCGWRVRSDLKTMAIDL